jgi:predicted O-linked N-acetylglucosamine transferase (SPINDLY family)
MRAGAYEQALQLHRQGALDAAAHLYRQLLAASPLDADVLHLFAALNLQQGQLDAGITLLRRSLAARPAQPEVLLSLARACSQARRFEHTVEACQQALAAQPNWPAVLLEQANAQLNLGRAREALISFDRLLLLTPHDAVAWCNRGAALLALGETESALASYERALQLQPSRVDVHCNRAQALRRLGRREEALAAYEHALALDARLNRAHRGRGLVLYDLGRVELARDAFTRAIELQPDDLDALVALGNLYRDTRRVDEALALFERALLVDPRCVEALCNRGNVLLDLQHYEAAIESYDRALRLRPETPAVLANRAGALQQVARFEEAAAGFARVLELAPDYEFAAGALMQCQLQTCSWTDWDRKRDELRRDVECGRRAVHPFVALALTADAMAQRQAAALHAERFEAAASPRERLHVRSPGKIRLAYVSADLREHAVSYLMTGVLERHDRAQFETVAISLSPPERGALGERLLRAFDRFEDVSACSDAQVVERARALEIDIAVDLMGYTRGARPAVFAQRIAPVQVNYLGYPGTSAARFMDYILADDFVIPQRLQHCYSEQVIRLPCFQPNDDLYAIEPAPKRREVGLPEDAMVLCSFNNTYKLNPDMFEVWMRILRDAPQSVLWLLGDRPTVRDHLRQEAQARGVEPERLIFATRLPYGAHLARLQLADLFLDTLPYNAGTTASDALRVGVPVLTCVGEAFAARMAGSLLHALGLPELVTEDLAVYGARALDLLRAPQALSSLRTERLHLERRRALFDSARCCQVLEEAFRIIHSRAQQGLDARGFAVNVP